MESIRRFAKITSFLTLVAFLSGCAETADGRKTQAQGTAIGAVGGAALGALIGVATGGGGQAAARGAIIGGSVGAAGGFAYGTHVAHQKAKYASAEQWLDRCIASARSANRRAYAYNHSLNQKIASLEARSRAAIAARDQAAARQIRGEVVSLRKEASVEQQQVNRELEAQQGASGDKSARTASNYGAYNHEMGELRHTKAALSQNVGRLASLENQVNL